MAATVQTTIVHLAQDEKFRYEKPFKIMLDVSELGYPQSNYELTESKTDAIDATSLRETLSINKNGFQFLVSPTKLHDSDFDDEQLIIKSYYPEVISLVQRLFTGGAEVFALGHRVCNKTPCISEPLRVRSNVLVLPEAHFRQECVSRL